MLILLALVLLIAGLVPIASAAPPTVEAGLPIIVNEGDPIKLEGTANPSTPGQQIIDEVWQHFGTQAASGEWTTPSPPPDPLVIDDGNPVTIPAAPSVSEDTIYTFRFTAVGVDGAQIHPGSDTVTVRVNDVPNQRPVANAGEDKNVNELTSVELDGTASSDEEDGTVASYFWEQTSGTSIQQFDETSSKPTFDAPNVDPGGETLTFELRVTDSQGATSASPDTVDVIVNDVTTPGSRPTAVAGADQNVDRGATVTLNAQGSSDPDGDPLTYEWTQTPGTTQVTLNGADSATPTFLAPDVGPEGETLEFTLAVDDGNGNRHTDTVNIGVRTSTGIPWEIIIGAVAAVGAAIGGFVLYRSKKKPTTPQPHREQQTLSTVSKPGQESYDCDLVGGTYPGDEWRSSVPGKLILEERIENGIKKDRVIFRGERRRQELIILANQIRRASIESEKMAGDQVNLKVKLEVVMAGGATVAPLLDIHKDSEVRKVLERILALMSR